MNTITGKVLFTNPHSGAITHEVVKPTKNADGEFETFQQTSAPTVPVLHSWRIGTLQHIKDFLDQRYRYKGFVVTHPSPLNTGTSLLIQTLDGGEIMQPEYPHGLTRKACRVTANQPILWESFLFHVHHRIIAPLRQIEVKIEYQHPADYNTNGTFVIHCRRVELWL